MEPTKRARAELRELIEQKRQEQEAQTILVADVNLLREQKATLTSEILLEQEKQKQFLSSCKQEVDFLRKEEASLKASIGLLESSKLDKQKEIEDISANINVLKLQLLKQKEEVDLNAIEYNESVSKIKTIREALAELFVQKSDIETYINFQKSSLNTAKSEYEIVLSKIKQAEIALDILVKEQNRNTNWDQYLQDKENFLIEQFKLLGVKYVVYNSK